MKTDKFDFSEDFKEIAEQAEKQSGYEAVAKDLKDCTEAFKELTAECKQLRKELQGNNQGMLYKHIHELVRNHHNQTIDHIRDIDALIYNVDSLLLKLTAMVDAIRRKQSETTAAFQSLADNAAPISKSKPVPRAFYSRLLHSPWLRKFAILLLILTTILSVATTCILAIDNNRLRERNRQLSITEDKLHTLRDVLLSDSEKWAATDSVWRPRFNKVDMYYADPVLYGTDIRLLKRHIKLNKNQHLDNYYLSLVSR